MQKRSYYEVLQLKRKLKRAMRELQNLPNRKELGRFPELEGTWLKLELQFTEGGLPQFRIWAFPSLWTLLTFRAFGMGVAREIAFILPGDTRRFPVVRAKRQTYRRIIEKNLRTHFDQYGEPVIIHKVTPQRDIRA